MVVGVQVGGRYIGDIGEGRLRGSAGLTRIGEGRLRGSGSLTGIGEGRRFDNVEIGIRGLPPTDCDTDPFAHTPRQSADAAYECRQFQGFSHKNHQSNVIVKPPNGDNGPHMKFDYLFPSLPPTAAAEHAHRAARIGYDGFFTAETGHEPFLPICLASRAEPGLEVGTAITLAFPRSPMVMAQLAWDCQIVAGGRFLLGLGTQIKPHITRRFSTEWSRPTARLRDYIGAVRAVWDCFQNGTRLRYQGDFYQLTLMTPFFNPGPNRLPSIPIYIAGVGPLLSRLAGEVCDGFHVHPFHTAKYLDELVLPAIAEGAAQTGRTLDDVELATPVFVVTGRSAQEMNRMIRPVKEQIAFYASTPSYAPILDIHGWDFGPTLRAMSKRGKWRQMADVIPDEVVNEVAVVAPPEELADRLLSRYEGRTQRISLYSMAAEPIFTEDEWAELAARIKGGATG